MDKINPVSVGGLLVMGIKSASVTSFVGIILLCMVLCCAIELHDDLCSSILQPVLNLLYVTLKSYGKGFNSHVVVLTPKTNSNYNTMVVGEDENILLRRDAELVMGRLGLSCDPNGDKLQERFGAQDFETLFSRSSLEEVKQAFDMFDENNDGYIDEKEVKKVLWKLGVHEFSEMDCRRMIKIYDDNLDGLIDFTEFCKLLEDSFC